MKPVKTAYVKIWGDTVGAVAWDEKQGCAIFEYESSFLKKGLDLSPIHMGIEMARRSPRFSFPAIDRMTFHGLPGILANSLPDQFGNNIIDGWLKRHGRDPKSFNSVERLCYVGTRGMGALEFEPQLGSMILNKSVEIDVEHLMELAQEVMTERSKLDVHISENDEGKLKAEALLDILRVGTSAGGAVPKAIIAINKEGHIVSGQSATPEGYTHWILKFDGISTRNPKEFGKSFEDGRVEYAYYLMARDAGIDMADCELLCENGRAHFMTKRFDRFDQEKIHVLSLACIGHLGWNPVGSSGYEDAFYVMRKLNLPYPQQEQQYRRMIFNALAKNVDDHTKNISYIMDKQGVWKLSPAYDLTLSFDSVEIFGDRHKMTINGKQKDFTKKDFLEVAENMEINKPKEIIAQVIDTVKRWPDFAKLSNVSNDIINYVGDQHLDLTSARQ